MTSCNGWAKDTWRLSSRAGLKNLRPCRMWLISAPRILQLRGHLRQKFLMLSSLWCLHLISVLLPHRLLVLAFTKVCKSLALGDVVANPQWRLRRLRLDLHHLHLHRGLSDHLLAWHRKFELLSHMLGSLRRSLIHHIQVVGALLSWSATILTQGSGLCNVAFDGLGCHRRVCCQSKTSSHHAHVHHHWSQSSQVAQVGARNAGLRNFMMRGRPVKRTCPPLQRKQVKMSKTKCPRSLQRKVMAVTHLSGLAMFLQDQMSMRQWE